jgi:hypothetical protein
MVDEQVTSFLFLSLTGFYHKTDKVAVKGYKNR